ncbi:MAG: hypothetical protein KGH98_04670 [Candidatus Micrarchaeota archaeon]|nr:hypothetical protein [Candidatus Micrarchaeota archaeon]
MDQLQLRENEVFATLKKLAGHSFVVIGGYAANAYTLPRFSVDCDIVAERPEAEMIGRALERLGYIRTEMRAGERTGFARYEKSVGASYRVSFDIMIGEVYDRQTGVRIGYRWIFDNSQVMVLKGKTIRNRLKVRVVGPDALFVMKIISCRAADIRDLFMMAFSIRDKKWIKREVSSRFDFSNRLRKVENAVSEGKFRDGLQGVYGLIDGSTFERNLRIIKSFRDIDIQ